MYIGCDRPGGYKGAVGVGGGYLCRHRTSGVVPENIGYELCCIGLDCANVMCGPTLFNDVADVGSDRESAIAWRGKEGVFIRMMVPTSSDD